MFTNISWGQYLMAMSLLSAVYYLAACINFYGIELKEIITGKRKINTSLLKKVRKVTNVALNNNAFEAQPLDESKRNSSLIQREDKTTSVNKEDLINQLDLVIEECADQEIVKPEFIYKISGILKNYPGLKYMPDQQLINNSIIAASTRCDYLLLSEDDLAKMWSS